MMNKHKSLHPIIRILGKTIIFSYIKSCLYERKNIIPNLPWKDLLESRLLSYKREQAIVLVNVMDIIRSICISMI